MSPWDILGWGVVGGIATLLARGVVDEARARWLTRPRKPTAYRSTRNIRFGKEIVYLYKRDAAGNYHLGFKPKSANPWVESPEAWAKRVREYELVKMKEKS